MLLMLDNQQYVSKPNGDEIKDINTRLSINRADVSISELAIAVSSGQTFCCGYFGETADDGQIYRRNECWSSQQVFALDFDNGIPIDGFMEQAETYGVIPAIVYTTFSHTEDHHKFRAIWQTSSPVDDLRVRWLILQSLAHIFGQKNDPRCYDPARLFFGGKELKIFEPDNYVNPYELVLSVIAAIEDKDDNRNSKRSIEQFCRVTWLEMVNGVPNVMLEEEISNESSIAKNDEKHSLYRISLECTKCVKICNNTRNIVMLHFTVTEEQFSPVKTDRWGRDTIQIGDITDTKVKRDLIDQRPENLAKACQLAQAFEDGKYLGHALRWQLMTWYTNINKGVRYFINMMFKHYEPDRANKFKYYTKYAQAHGYRPARCSDECPYFEGCNKKWLPLPEKLGAKRGQIVKNGYLCKPLAQAEEEYGQAFQRAIEAKDNKIYIIKAPTGIGKTENYLGIKNTLIAVPTHKLREEVLQRFIDAGYDKPATAGPFPRISPKIDQQIHDFYQAGAYQEAIKYIKWLCEVGQCNPCILQYHEEYQEYCGTRKTAIATHQRVLFQRSIRQEQIIFDEDPFNSLVQPGEVKPADIDVLNEAAGETLIDLDSIEPYRVYLPSQVIKHVFDEYLPRLANKISSNLGQLAKAKAIVKLKNDSIYYVIRRDLPTDRKIIIVSATINETLYRQMYGDRIDFIDIGSVQTTGRIYQDTQFSYSRQCFAEHPDLLPDIVRGFQLPYITHSKYEEAVPDFIAELHFGEVQGIDYLKGKDIMVIGTPHANNIAYLMYAIGIGFEVPLDTEMKYQQITRNSLSFWFMTYDNPDLREVQLYLIENELYQAIGRARALRINALVFVFSNFPMPEAELTDLYIHTNEGRNR